MSIKSKTILLSIITFGIYYAIIRNKAHKLTKINSSITTSNLIDFDVNELINCLGGKENIDNISTSISTFSVSLKRTINIDKDMFLRKFKIKGINKINNKYMFLIGDNATTVGNKIKEICLSK